METRPKAIAQQKLQERKHNVRVKSKVLASFSPCHCQWTSGERAEGCPNGGRGAGGSRTGHKKNLHLQSLSSQLSNLNCNFDAFNFMIIRVSKSLLVIEDAFFNNLMGLLSKFVPLAWLKTGGSTSRYWESKITVFIPFL